MYVTSLFRVLPQSVSMEAIKEVETLPRAAPASVSRVTTEEHYEIQTQQRFSQQVRVTSPMVAMRHCSGSFFRECFNLQPPVPPVSTRVVFSKFKERLITVVSTNWGSLVSDVGSEVKNGKENNHPVNCFTCTTSAVRCGAC